MGRTVSCLTTVFIYGMFSLQGHEQAVNEVQFHAQQPHHMFSCSESGEVWHWDGSAVSRSNFGNQGGSGSSNNPTQCLWFNNEAVKHRVETASLLARQGCYSVDIFFRLRMNLSLVMFGVLMSKL